MSELDQILAGEDIDETLDDEGGADEPEGDESAATPAAEDEAKNADESGSDNADPMIAGLQSGIAAERHKRQQAVDRVRALERQLAELQQRQQGEQEQLDVWDDPAAVIKAEVSAAVSALESRMFNLSEANARVRHGEKFDEMRDFFFDKLAADNPALIEQARASADPYEYIYQTAVNQKRIADMGDPKAYEERIRAEERARVEAEMRAKIEAGLSKAKSVPDSISNARASKEPAAPGTNESLEDIFQR